MHRCRRPEELEPTVQGGAATAQGEVQWRVSTVSIETPFELV